MRALFLNGSVGAGKTTIARAVAIELEERGEPCAVLDLDSLVLCSGAPEDDPFNQRLMRRNLAALWPNFRAAGATTLILSGVLESVEDRKAIGQALDGLEPEVCRLVAPVETLQERVHAREVVHPGLRDWLVTRAPELTAILDAAGVDDFVVANDGAPIAAVAQEVVHKWDTWRS